MGKKLLKQLNDKHAGFSGITHWLIAIFLFFCMWLIPWSFASGYINAISSDKIFGVMIFFIIGGASLLPDLDSSPLQEGGSTAVYQLGALGMGLSTLAITISGVVYALFHTKYDEKPKSQHRMLFHAPLIPILLYLFVKFCIPDSNDTLSNNLNLDNISIIILVAFAGISVYLGASMLIYKVLHLIGKQRWTQFICLALMAFSIFQSINMPYKRLKLIGIAIALGYLFHIVGDLFSKGSSPIFFPIPIPSTLDFKNKKFKFQLWKKPYILGSRLAIETGGTINIILNFALFGLNALLCWYLFFK